MTQEEFERRCSEVLAMRREVALCFYAVDWAHGTAFYGHRAWHAWMSAFPDTDILVWQDELYQLRTMLYIYGNDEWLHLANMLDPLMRQLRGMDTEFTRSCEQCLT